MFQNGHWVYLDHHSLQLFRLRWELTFQKVRDILELWDWALTVAAVLLQQGQDVVELAAGVSGEQLLQIGVDGLPGGHLLSGVLNPRNGRTTNHYKQNKMGMWEWIYLCSKQITGTKSFVPLSVVQPSVPWIAINTDHGKDIYICPDQKQHKKQGNDQWRLLWTGQGTLHLYIGRIICIRATGGQTTEGWTKDIVPKFRV